MMEPKDIGALHRANESVVKYETIARPGDLTFMDAMIYASALNVTTAYGVLLDTIKTYNKFAGENG